jgi:soluble lytic murein transglycosylase
MRWRSLLKVVLLALLLATPVAGLLLGMTYWRREKLREREYDAEIAKAATRYKLDPFLVKAVIWRESRFDRNARGKAGEIGLMQVMPLTGEEWAEAERIRGFSESYLWEPSQNIQAGAWYLSKCLRRYTNTDNPIPYALADYNAGRTHVLRWNKGAAATNATAFLTKMDYPGTRRYALSIMERYDYYQRRAGRRARGI